MAGVWTVSGGGVVGGPTLLASEVDSSNKTQTLLPPTSSVPADPAVVVGLREINGQSNTPIGNYAYWVSDEGVKLSLAKVDQEKHSGFTASDRGLSVEEMNRLPQLTPGRTHNERLFSSYSEWDSRANDFKKTTSYDQLSLTGLDKENLVNARHRATWRSMGVLANSESGGLKQDLSFTGSDVKMDPFSQTAALQSWVQNRATGPSIPMVGSILPSGGTLQDGEPIFTTPLVLTEFGLYMRFSRKSSGNGLRFLMAISPELWNPNSFPITVSPSGTPDLIFEIEGLPELSCEWVTGTSDPNDPQVLATGTFTFDPNTTSLSTDEGNNEFVSGLSMEINKSVGYLEAGEVYKTSMRAEGVMTQSLTSDSTSTKTDDFISLRGEASEVTIRVKNTSGELLQEFISIPFPAFDTTGRQTINDNLTGVANRNFEEFQIVFHFRLDDETVTLDPNTSAPIEHWFTETDFRSISMPSENYNDFVIISSPDDAAFEPLFQSQPDLFAFGFRYFPVFDVPTGPPISIGSLQHLQFAATPSYSVGNTWGNTNDAFGNTFNSYFDRYFFSTTPQGTSSYDPQSGAPLANAHLIPQETSLNNLDLASLQSPFSSKQFLIDGAFNINCTDPLVWQAVLGSMNLTNWDYKGDSGASINNGIFRFPFGVDQYRYEYSNILTKDWFKNGSLPLWSNAYRVGLRELDINALETLATQITDRIKNRGTPFASLKDLADSGLLQNSIDATPINSTNGLAYSSNLAEERIPAYAPAFVSQADILQLIAPFALARSDTFIIRAYGSSLNGSTVSSEQVCEAVVQRISEPVTFRNPTNPTMVEEDYITPPDSFGRRFKILSFTWLDSK